MIRFFATISLLVCLGTAVAQDKKSVVIGSLIDRPNALLVISPPGSNQGFLLPQLSSLQRMSISCSSPADDGLMVFDITEKSFYYWNNGGWVKGLAESGSQSLAYDAATQRLTISGNNSVDLSTLKEVPVQTGQSGKYLTTDGTTLTWATLSSMGDISSIITASGSGLSGGATTGDVNLVVNTDGASVSVNGTNQLQVTDGGITANKVANNAVTSDKIADGTITNTDLAANSVTNTNIADGTIANVDLSANSVTTLNIVDGTVANADLSANSVTSSNIVNGTIVNADLATNSVNSSNIVDGTVTTDDILNGTIANVDLASNSVASSNIIDGTIANADLVNDAVTSAKIQDGTVAPADIASGGNSQVLTTNATGVVTWVPQSSLATSQTLSVTGDELSISGGNTVNLTAAGAVTGPLDNLAIAPGAADQVFVTNATGTATQWVPAGGDVTGSASNSTVARIQNRNVATSAPAVGDALVWNGSAWTPTTITGGSPTVQYYAIDPANFQGLQLNGNKDASLGLMEGNNGLFAFAMEDSRTIAAPINLPHGAIIQNVTVYYEITNILGLLTPINVRLIQKSLSGGLNIDLTNIVIAPLLSLGVANQSGSLTHTVDNSTSSYRLLVRFSNIGDADEISEATQRIYGVRIQYLK